MGIAFYLWVGMFGLFVVAQFWAFAADLYTDERGRRLLPMIAIGATSGATVGSFIVQQVVDSELLDSGTLLLLANIPLGLSIWLTGRADTAGPLGDGYATGEATPASPEPESGAPDRGAFALIRAHPYLVLVAAVTLIKRVGQYERRKPVISGSSGGSGGRRGVRRSARSQRNRALGPRADDRLLR